MEILVSSPRGFCAGVVRAIDMVELALEKYGAPVYIKHQIVHNPHVVEDLESKGAITVETVEEIPEGSHVVFSAHGSPPEDFAKARERNLKVIDAVCPLVTKVHNEAKKYAALGKKIILVGHEGHQEVKGTMGQTPMTLVNDKDLQSIPNWDTDTDLVVLTQTTLSVNDTQNITDKIDSEYSNTTIRNDICYATTNRQSAVKDMAKQVDAILVIGAENSSNCNRLKELSLSLGIPAMLVNNITEIPPEFVSQRQIIGVTSGASTPESLVQDIIAFLEPTKISYLSTVEEDISFTIRDGII
ncbi:MAG: 4-hydroxy-3-methylbut-2-enyl diphosphate reductase [Dehalococcoidia bacterium]|tara:strand:+ start:37945 stop:38844 length:900 start_codon:yes stop_codon:yes gene_type:complete